jgi:ribosome-binding ATPase
MGFRCGIIGLPNVGKSTLFNALTASHADAANYPFCTIDPNIGIVTVPDDRLGRIAEIYNSKKNVPTTLEFFDIAGLVKGSSTGEGLGNQFLSHIRTTDAIVHVVRCFDDPNIIHVNGRVNPKSDIEIIETELILKDVETIEKRQADITRKLHSGDKKAEGESDFYSQAKEHLLSGKMAKHLPLHNVEDKALMRDLHLLTDKPVMYICNVREKEMTEENDHVKSVREIAIKENAKVMIVCASIEAEISNLPENERPEFLNELGLIESGLTKVIRQGYDLLDLITYFTSGAKETHARTIKKGTTAVHAAGEIHGDFERGFIRAEIIKYDDINRLGSENAVRDAGLLHVEGKEYIIKDGEIMFVRFNI